MAPQTISESDSENDEDYVPPPSDNESFSSDKSKHSSTDSKRRKRRRVGSPPLIENSELEVNRQALWEEFTSSVPTSSGAGESSGAARMVTVEVKHKFAGQEVIQTKEVLEGSEEAKTYAASTASINGHLDALDNRAGSSGNPSVQKRVKPLVDDASPRASSSENTPDVQVRPVVKRPIRTSLAALAASTKPKKLNTLEKSKMDWNSHLSSSSREEINELEQNRRGGGYLEKMEFLGRVGERKEEVIDAGKKRG